MMKKITTTILMVIVTLNFAFGQNQNATTENGEKVILFPDGTWEYPDKKSEIPITETSDCSNWIETTTDKMTGDSRTSAKSTLIVSTDGGKTGFGIFMMKSSKGNLILVIQAVGAGNCIDEGAKINILFDDGEKLELYSDGDFNCDAKATVYFGGVFGKKSKLKTLKSKKIATMRVWTSDSFVQKDFTQENKDEFFNVINCLTK